MAVVKMVIIKEQYARALRTPRSFVVWLPKAGTILIPSSPMVAAIT